MTDTSSITLRAASLCDIAFLTELRRASMWNVVTNHYPWIEEAQQERVFLHFESARIICSGNRDIGLLKVIYGSKRVHLCQIQLLPEFQGNGIGSKLISKLQEEVGSSGLPITLSVFRSNPAINLYTRLGFHIATEDSNSFTMIWHSTKGLPNHGVGSDVSKAAVSPTPIELLQK